MKALKLAYIFLMFSIAACREDDPVLLTGDIVGRIGYYEANYFNFVDSLPGVQVTLRKHDGTEQSTTTSVDGRYVFEKVEAGVYTLRFDKTSEAGPFVDYSRDSRNSLTHLGGGVTIVRDYYLMERPGYPLNNVSYSWDNNMVTLTASMGKVEGDKFNFLIFFANHNDVSPDNHLYDFNTTHSSDLTVTENATGEKTVEIRVQLLEPQDYVVIYPYSVWGTEALGQPSEVIHIPR